MNSFPNFLIRAKKKGQKFLERKGLRLGPHARPRFKYVYIRNFMDIFWRNFMNNVMELLCRNFMSPSRSFLKKLHAFILKKLHVLNLNGSPLNSHGSPVRELIATIDPPKTYVVFD